MILYSIPFYSQQQSLSKLKIIKFIMKGEINQEVAFLDTLLKQNNGKISVFVFRRPSYSHQHLHYNCHHQTSCNNCAVFSLFHRAYSIIANNDDLNKENSWIKQALKEKGYQEGFISKIFARIAIMFCLSQNSKHKPQISKKNIYWFCICYFPVFPT